MNDEENPLGKQISKFHGYPATIGFDKNDATEVA
jgi:hypothetical protein